MVVSAAELSRARFEPGRTIRVTDSRRRARSVLGDLGRARGRLVLGPAVA